MNRIAVTGIGVVTSIGFASDIFWSSLLSGKNGISKIESFDTSAYQNHMGGEVKGFDPSNILSAAEIKVYGRASQFAIVATIRALEDANLVERDHKIDNDIGVALGTTFGESEVVERATRQSLLGGNANSVKRIFFKQYSPDIISVNVAKKFSFDGPNVVIPTACAAGNYAIAYSAFLIKLGISKIMIAGGVDPFSHVGFSGFYRLGNMAKMKCQPFDKNRTGMLIGEGAGIVVLENMDSAKERGAKIHAEIIGYGFSSDANHMTVPQIDGLVSVMERVLKNARLKPSDIDYISAHGTGTLINDKVESLAIRKVFYEKGNQVPVSSIKSMLGHTMGAASALEAVASILTINNGQIPPTINYEIPDPDCDIDCVPNVSRKSNVRFVLSNSFAFGGNNACIIFGNV